MRVAAIILAVAIIDQLSKAWARNVLPAGEPLPVINGIFEFRLVYNPGAAFGLFPQQRYLLIALSIVCLAALFVFYVRVRKNVSVWQMGTALIAGGIIGDLIDRVKDGYVTDFLHFPPFPFCRLFQVFNIADAAIVIGVIIVFCGMVLEERE